MYKSLSWDQGWCRENVPQTCADGGKSASTTNLNIVTLTSTSDVAYSTKNRTDGEAFRPVGSPFSSKNLNSSMMNNPSVTKSRKDIVVL